MPVVEVGVAKIKALEREKMDSYAVQSVENPAHMLKPLFVSGHFEIIF